MIIAENASKKFGDFFALKELNCNIPTGCIYGLVGSNGAGKSTFLRLITGVYKTDSGAITFNGNTVYENPETKKQISYIPDELYFVHGASMNRMASMYKHIYPNFDKKRFVELTNLFELNPKANIHSFSKGMKRQAATILALSCKTSFIFFDETFDGLDPVLRNLVKNLISSDVIERNVTAIITSHSLRELEDTCDQLALLHKGGLVFESDIQNLKTSFFKVQVAFKNDYDVNLFSELEITNYIKKGSVSNLIIKGNRDKAEKILRAKNPILLDILPLSLEEVFIHEMSALGYAFSDIMN